MKIKQNIVFACYCIMLGQTYVSCDWRLESKDKFYDVRKAEVHMYMYTHVLCIIMYMLIVAKLHVYG